MGTPENANGQGEKPYVAETDGTDGGAPALTGPKGAVALAATEAAGEPRVLRGRWVWVWAGVIGVAGGFMALAYYLVMQLALWGVWKKGAHLDMLNLDIWPHFRPWILLITTVGGIGVGLVLKWLGTPGEIAAVVNNIHMKGGRIDPKQTPSMVAASLVSITAGGSAGPEAPLVQIIGSFGSWVGDRLKLRSDLVRTFTFCGMGAALGAFFGAPLGGALFALEIPHRRGLEYYEALMPSVLAAVIAFFVFRAFIGYDGPIYHFSGPHVLSVWIVAVGALSGLGGGIIGTIFIVLFRQMERLMHPLHHHQILLAMLGGLSIGLLAQLSPITLFWGEYQITTLLQAGEQLPMTHGLYAAAGMLLALAALKMVAVGATLHSGFRGGFIFPLFFIGGAVGLAATAPLHSAFPHMPATVVVLCMMAATNVAVTKTPISTAVILTSLSGTALLPALATACFASFLLTTRVSLISTQRGRARPVISEALAGA